MKCKKRLKKIVIAFLSLFLVGLIIFSVFIGLKEMRKKQYPIKYEEYVIKYSEEYQVPQETIYAVIYTESGFNDKAESSAGAFGLMQIIPSTFEWISGKIGENYVAEDVCNPEKNIKYGVYYLSYLYKKFGNWDTALASYNAGPGRVGGWLSDTRYSDDKISLKEIPIIETKNYVKKVNKVTKIYIELYFED